jgi:hypothetical protein
MKMQVKETLNDKGEVTMRETTYSDDDTRERLDAIVKELQEQTRRAQQPVYPWYVYPQQPVYVPPSMPYFTITSTTSDGSDVQ